ncbi:MAG: cAMP receptor protein [Syntrophaceae bacterium PtaU1.Bin231]|nr:MAG: cAMP receptor protein [Syntrophaceae bacterium PtaU1.Bin231]HOG16995.1 Crp/Fnr family transcriptional regulator [Syntrophales bacterium]
MNVVNFLARLPLFRGLPPRELDDLSKITTLRSFRQGETVFVEDEPASGFYILFSGKVKIFKLSPEGKEQILHIIEPGDSFAEITVFEGGKYPANAEALEQSRTVFFPAAALIRKFRSDPYLAMNMMGILSSRLREFAQTIENLSLRGVPERLATYLLHLQGLKNGADMFDLDIKKGVLANLLGTTGESVSRTLARMSEAGLIEVHGKRITLLKRRPLEEIAAGRRKLD